MSKIFIIILMAALLTACGNGNETAAGSDSTSNPKGDNSPATVDTSVMGRRMGDTTPIMGDSTK